MTNQAMTPNKSKRNKLDSIVDSWESRLKLTEMAIWIPRGMILALALAITLAIITRIRFLMPAGTLAVVAGVLVVGGIILSGVLVWMLPRSRRDLARRFDLNFKLKERISTAYEILEGHVQTHPDIERHQLTDAYEAALEIDPKLEMPFKFRILDFVMVILLAGILGLLLILPNQLEAAQRPTRTAAVDSAAEDVRDIIEVVANDTELDEVDRQELLDSLEISLDTLEEEDTNNEEVFAVMTEVDAELQERIDELTEALQQRQEALDNATDTLEPFSSENSDEENNASDTEGQPSMQEVLENLQDEINEMSPEEQQALADALRQAADDLEALNPELAESLRDAAEALQNGDTQGAQEALQQAQEQLQQLQQDLQQQQQSAQNLQQAADQAQEGAQQIAQQDQNQQGGQNPQQNDGQGPQNAPNSQLGQSDSPQQNAADGQQPGQNLSESSDAPPTNNDNPTNLQVDSDDSSGSGAGDGNPSNEGSDQSFEDSGADSNQGDNNPDGGGEIEFESLYAPQTIDGNGEDQIILEPDAGDAPVVEGDFQDNPTGISQVTYDTVFSDYQNAANRALESDYVPLGLRDVVREYFTSLQPQRGEE